MMVKKRGVNPISEVIRPCEWFLPGHPDILADALAASLIAQMNSWDRGAQGEVKVSIDHDCVHLTGHFQLPDDRFPPSAHSIAARIWAHAGYRVGGLWGPAPDQLKIVDSIMYTSSSDGERSRLGDSHTHTVLSGYAFNCEGTNFMPTEHWFARNLAMSLFNETETSVELCPNGSIYIELTEFLSGDEKCFKVSKVVARLRSGAEISEEEFFELLKKHIKFNIQKGYECFGLKRLMPDDEHIELDTSNLGHETRVSYKSGCSGRHRMQSDAGLRAINLNLSGWSFDKGHLCNQYAFLPRQLAIKVMQDQGIDEVQIIIQVFKNQKPRILSIRGNNDYVDEKLWPMIDFHPVGELSVDQMHELHVSERPIQWGSFYPDSGLQYPPAFNYLILERTGVEVSWGEGKRSLILDMVAEKTKLPSRNYDW